MPPIVATSWWHDWSALPDRLLWARLRLFADGSAEVFDLDVRYHRFGSRGEAALWLNEDEYSPLAHLVEDGEVDVDVAPPRGPGQSLRATASRPSQTGVRRLCPGHPP